MLGLSLETMGALALAALWLNTLLIVADAAKRHAALGRLGADLADAAAKGRLVRATITGGQGPNGAFATHTVEQIGRAITVAGPPRILFTDRASSGAIHGGRARTGEREVLVSPAPEALVWCSSHEPRGDVAAFDAAWPRASTFKGFSTTIAHNVRPSEEVWLWLDRAASDVEEVRARLVSREDPARVVRAARLPLRGLVVVALLGVSSATVLALWPPVFGLVSTLGGAAGLGFFLAIQPLGIAARDKALLPDRRRVGGLWQRDR